MAYRHDDRDHIQLIPPSIEEYVAVDDPVRAYDAFVESLSLDELALSSPSGNSYECFA
jgi:hypothetical protein